jgi:hypothetical protein
MNASARPSMCARFRAPRDCARWYVVAFALVQLHCGYHSLASQPVAETLAVLAVGRSAVDGMTEAAVVAGARATLATEGALRTGTDYPRLEIEVVADDFAAGGVIAERGAPHAQGTDVRVVAHATLRRKANDPSAWESGEVVATSTYATRNTDELTQSQLAVRAAARDVGRTLALRALGDPAASGFRAAPESRR